MQLFVLGMHRSGTSAVARILNLMGAYFGPEGQMMGAALDNPKGHWERLDILEINEWLIQVSGAEWHQVASFETTDIPASVIETFENKIKKILLEIDSHRPWVIKDPRLCLLFPLWKPLLEVPVCLHVHRNPIQIAQSLRTHHKLPLPVGIALWEKYTLQALEASAGLPRVVISHKALIEKPVETVKQLYEDLLSLEVQGLRLPGEREITSFIDPKLFRERGDRKLQDEFINQNQSRLIRVLEQKGKLETDILPPFSQGSQEVLLGYEKQLKEIQDLHSRIQSQHEEVQNLHSHLQAQHIDREALREQAVQLQAHSQSLENKINEQADALEEKARQVSALQGEIRRQNEEQEARANDLDVKVQQIPVLQGEIRRQNEELAALTVFAEKLNVATQTIFSSLTWRTGYFAAEFVRKITLRHKESLIQDHIQNLRSRFFSQRSSYFKRQGINDEELVNRNKYQSLKGRKIAIAALVTTRGDGELSGSAYIRLIQPLGHPSIKSHILVTICRLWEELISIEADIVLIQRNALPDLESARAIIAYCREQDIRLVYEIDDDLFAIRSKRELKRSYSQAGQDAAKLVIEKADRIITSSQPLQEQLRAINPCVSYLPNYLDEILWLKKEGDKFIKPSSHRNDNCVRILYMGTRTHAEDLKIIEKAYKKIKENYGKTVALEMVGGLPYGMKTFAEVIPVEGINPGTDDYHSFVSWIRKENRWDFGIIPLASTDFNRKKSYIKFLDYSALGLASVCSDIEPYRGVVENGRNGLLVSNDTEAWYKAIKGLIEDRDFCSSLASNAFHDLTRKYLLETNAEKYLEVCREILGYKINNSEAFGFSEFYEECYLSQNPDVVRAIKEGMFTSARHHWEICGYKEVVAGLRSYRPGTVLDYSKQHSFNPGMQRRLRAEIGRWPLQPLISVVMPVYNIKKEWLHKAVQSVKNQIYPHWELCIADDSSTNKETIDYLKGLQDKQIKIKFLKKNQGISGASNEALSLAQGEYIALLDNDDELTENALYEVAKAINEHQPDFIYSDEDKITLEGTLVEPYFKPDYSPDTILSNNYICHLGVYRKSIVAEIGGFRKDFEGSQDHDLLLRFLEKSEKVYHVPKILYHWRKIPGSTADTFNSKSYAWEAGRKALQEAMQRRSIKAQAEYGPHPGTYRIRREILNQPLVSIIIPFKDKPELLRKCLDSILDKSTYQNFEIIGISNNSTNLETDRLMQRYESLDRRIKFKEYNIPFNFSAINNYASTIATGEHLILLNNDIEIISPGWIEALLEHSQRPEIGAVGAKLYFPNDTIQHAGVIIGIGGIAAHSHKYFPRESNGYYSRPSITGNVSAVTAACLMVKKGIYEEVGGLEEKYLKIAFNDVDFCLRVMEKGYLNIYTPYCEAYHHESVSRGYEDTPKKQARFAAETRYMKKQHAEIFRKGDPYYNPNLTLNSEDFSVKLVG